MTWRGEFVFLPLVFLTCALLTWRLLHESRAILSGVIPPRALLARGVEERPRLLLGLLRGMVALGGGDAPGGLKQLLLTGNVLTGSKINQD